MTLDVLDLVTVAAVFVLAGAVKGIVGLGLPTISMALLSMLMPPSQAAALLVIPTILTNVWQAWDGPAFAMLVRRLWSMLILVAAGTLMATGALARGDVRLSTALLGAVLIAYAVLGLSGVKLDVPRRSEPVLSPAVGLITGVINGATGIFVVPGVPYMQGLGFSKDEMVQALAVSALVSSGALAVGLGMNHGFSGSVASRGVIALLAAFAGMAAGKPLRERLSIDAFRRGVLVALLGLGISMVVRFLA